MDSVVQYRQMYLNDRRTFTMALWQLNMLRIFYGYLHELGHLVETFVGHGDQDTPPPASGGEISREKKVERWVK